MKKSNLTLALAALFGLTAFFVACEKEHLPDPTISFQDEILPLIVTNCASSDCHSSSERAAGYDLSDYEGILDAVKPGDYKASKLYSELVKPLGWMPQDADRLPNADIEAIALWIEQGALDNAGTGCNTDGVTYSGTVAPLVLSWCSACHSGPNPTGLILLDNYEDLKIRVDNGLLLGTIRHDTGFMPMPDGGGMMPGCDIKKIERWVSDGALDN